MTDITGALKKIEGALNNSLLHVERDWHNIHVEISRPAGETRAEIKQALTLITAIREAAPDKESFGASYAYKAYHILQQITED